MYDLPPYTGTEPCQTGDPDRFFPEQGHKGTEAKRECVGCPLRDACFDYALHVAVEGIWAGTTLGERKRLRRKLRIVPESVTTEEVYVHRVDHDQIVRMANRGTPVDKIADLLHVGSQVVRRHLRDAGVAA